MLGRWKGVVALALAIGAAGPGCGDDDGGSGGCPECGPYADVLDALCGWMDRCPEALPYPIVYRSRQECVDILTFLFTCRLEDMEVDDVHNFTVVREVPEVDPAQAEACRAFLETASCDLIAGGFPEGSDAAGGAAACAGLFVPANGDDGDDGDSGSAGVGEDCEERSCRDGLYCRNPTYLPASQEVTCRTCAALPGAGEECANGYECADAHYCKYQGEGLPNLCTPLEDEGTECTSSEVCRSGFCNPIRMVCDSGGESGDPCIAMGDCRSGGYCDLDAGRCLAMAENGEACGADGQCRNGACDEPSGRCGLPNGSSCYSGTECASNRCDSTTQMCEATRANGESCTYPEECASQHCSMNVCAERCYDDTECAAGEFCWWQSSSCVPQRPDGSSCEGDEECLGGQCNSNDVCGAPPQVGDPCGESFECYPLGYCSGGACAARKRPDEACVGYDECLDPFICIEGKCTLINLACEPASAGEQCAFFRVCDDASWCDLFDGIQCKPRVGEGEMCAGSEQCVLETWCGPDATCAPRLGEGEVCTGTDECQAGLWCVSSGTTSRCEAGTAGMPCSYDEPCPDGYYCDDRNEVCLPRPGQGQPCDDYDMPCAEAFFCGDDRTCVPRLGAGATCYDDLECAPEFYCYSYDRVCQPDRTLGQSCAEDYYGVECAAGLYCDGSSMCQEAVGPGGECNDAEQCLSGACFNAMCLSSAECVPPP